MQKESKVKVYVVPATDDIQHARRGINKLERNFRKYPDAEIIPYARGSSFKEIAENVIPDRDGAYAHPLYLFASRHMTTIGVAALAKKTREFLEEKKETNPLDILSVSAGMDGSSLRVVALIRAYDKKPHFGELYAYLGEKQDGAGRKDSGPRLVIPPGVYREISEEEIEEHAKLVRDQDMSLFASTKEAPFLNSIDRYVPRRLANIDERQELVYDLRTKDMQVQLVTSYDNFISVFDRAMTYVTTTEKDSYYNVLRGQMKKEAFFDVIEAYLNKTFVETRQFPIEDLPALKGKLDRALFQLYIVQDLIDDPMITDIKITDPFSIRVRVRGQAYLCNITFIDTADYFRFVSGLAISNGISLNTPDQTFSSQNDENFLLRYTLTAPYATCTGYPYVHIRKVPRKKMMAEDLIKAGMFDEKIRDYLIDCGKYSTGVVFAGPPGSGKTTILNWFLEDAYESSAEILVIQENDELFAYRKGVMFEHPVENPPHGQQPCSMELLSKLALVAGANVFVIGEAKGAEICSAITLSNSGCRTAITIHAQSSTDTIDKMTDLAMRGSANTTYDQAKRMIRSFQTIVYLEDFKVQEISEIVGYDNVKKDMIYRPIYRNPKRARG